MRRRGILRLLVALVVTGVVLLAALAAPGPARAAPAQDQPATTTPAGEGDNPSAPERDIIPRPDSGEAPDDAGDRGGALQLVVLAAVVVGVGAVVTLAVRESRRNRRPRTPAGSGGERG